MTHQPDPLRGARWIADGGHAWLVVATAAARQVPGISQFSYISPEGERTYLECDCDAARFAAHYGVTLAGLPQTHYEDDAPCRRYPTYPWAASHDDVIAWARQDQAVTA